jgi:hypothetical protein
MSVRGGVEYIAKQQLADGGFLAYQVGHSAKHFRTTFVPSLIALALHEVRGTQAIQTKIAQFLLAQKSSDWSWNYWDRTSTDMQKRPCPDDLDDTFVALSHLWRHDKTLFTPELMAKIVSLLFVTEVEEGGPYVTWITDGTGDKVWRDIDVIVNGNVASFLALQDVSLPRLEAIVEKAIDDKHLSTPYYPGTLPGAYLLARWYKGAKTTQLQNLILELQYGDRWGSAHETALAVSALVRLGYSPKKLRGAIHYLTDAQKPDGSWECGVMYIVDTEHGAPALTTALCLEALSLHKKADRALPKNVVRQPKDQRYEAVVARVKDTISTLNQRDLEEQTMRLLTDIVKQDTDKQIVMLPWLVKGVVGVDIPEKTLHNLAAVSLWGWMAYTTFDDFLDNEGDPKLLPSAVFAQRQVLATLANTLVAHQGFHHKANATLDQIDGANAWEVTHCRGYFKRGRLYINELPDYGRLDQLADRSLGHTIAGIGVLYAAGQDVVAHYESSLLDFFRHYLIARQLNDDAHDWEEDLLRGHINSTATLILKQWLKTKGHSLAKGVDLKRSADTLRLIMWEDVIEEVCGLIDDHIQLARRALNQPNSTLDMSRLLQLLEPLERATQETRTARKQALEFITQLSS